MRPKSFGTFEKRVPVADSILGHLLGEYESAFACFDHFCDHILRYSVGIVCSSPWNGSFAQESFKKDVISPILKYRYA